MAKTASLVQACSRGYFPFIRITKINAVVKIKKYIILSKEFNLAHKKMFGDGHLDQMANAHPMPNPFNELLLWSVLCNLQQMALFTWERGDENLAWALVAGKLYNVMAKRTELDDAKADVTAELKAHVE